MKTHFIALEGKSACGLVIPDENLTDDVTAVTCGNCLRSAAFKTAADVEDAVGAVTVDSADAE